MKIFKTLFFLAALLLVFSSGAFAQTTQDVTVTAEVLQDITLNKTTDVDFGYIPRNGSPVLDPQGTNTAAVGQAGSSTSFGTIEVSASNDAEMTVSYDGSTTLADGSGNTMTFTADASGNSTNDIAASTDITSGGTVTSSSSGVFFIYVGGNLGSLADQPAGTYTDGATNGTGPITVSVSYN